MCQTGFGSRVRSLWPHMVNLIILDIYTPATDAKLHQTLRKAHAISLSMLYTGLNTHTQIGMSPAHAAPPVKTRRERRQCQAPKKRARIKTA
jgi:hypothetical protein